MDVLFVEAVEV